MKCWAISRSLQRAGHVGPELARLGTRGFVDGRRQRLSIKDVNITPNHHAIAGQWTFSDNFYADSEIGLDGRHWLAGAIWSHFARNAIPFLNFGEGLEPAGVDEDKDLGPTGARLLANPPMPSRSTPTLRASTRGST